MISIKNDADKLRKCKKWHERTSYNLNVPESDDENLESVWEHVFKTVNDPLSKQFPALNSVKINPFKCSLDELIAT